MKLKPLALRNPKAKGKPKENAGERGGRALSIWLYAAVLALVAVLAIGAVTVTALRNAAQVRDQTLAQLEERTAELLAARVSGRLQREFTSLAQLADQPRLTTALADGERAELDALQAEYLAAFPGALRLLVLPAGVNQPDLTQNPPIGYALLDMMRRAEQDRKPQPAEVHLPGQSGAHVNLLQPVHGAQGEVLGHLILSYPVKMLETALRGPWSGRVELRQGAVVLAASGNDQGGASYRHTIPQSRWALEYRGVPGHGTGLAPAELAIPAAALLALLAAVAAAFVLLRRRLLADGRTAVRLVQEAAAGKVGSDYSARLRELAPMITALLGEARRLSESVAAPVPARANPPAAATSPEQGMEVRTIPVPEQQPAPVASALEVAPPPEPEPEPEPPTKAKPTLVEIDPVILRAYDIRGVVGAGLDVDVVRRLGMAIGTRMAASDQLEVVVGRDGRLSSPELAQALIEGLVATGRTVFDIGQVPTPVMNFATFHLGTGAGVMVTGSHNPRDYNGLKIVLGGQSLSSEAIQELGRLAAYGPFAQGAGSVSRHDVLPHYIERIVQDVTLHRPLRIVVDCGNGVAGVVAPQVFRAMGCEVEELFCEVDGYFPNHHPDPTVRDNLEALISLVRLQGADLGLAFDGDGDRLGVVDSSGKVIWADRQLMLFAADVLARHPGADVVFDVKCSAKLAEVITDNAGVPVMWKTGHSLIRSKVAELGAPLGGDMSGHIFFADRWYGFDDAIYAGARLLELLSQDGRSSAEVFAELPESVGTPEIRLTLAEGEPNRIMKALEKRLLADFEQARLTMVDGVRADFPDGWVLVRASNTEPKLVLRFEAADQEALARLQADMRARLQAVKPDLALPF